MKRPDDQSFEEYRAFRADLNATIDQYSHGQWFWRGGTYRKDEGAPRMKALPVAVHFALFGPK